MRKEAIEFGSDAHVSKWISENFSDKRVAFVANEESMRKWASRVDLLVVPPALQFPAEEFTRGTNDVKYTTLRSLVWVKG